MLERLLMNEDGRYEWSYPGFVGVTCHRDGRIIWAEAQGLHHKYEGLNAILRIASNPTIECKPLDGDMPAQSNIEEDWDEVKQMILHQIDLSTRYYSLRTKLDDLYVRVNEMPEEMEDGPAKMILEGMPRSTCSLRDIPVDNHDFALWHLITLEGQGIVSIFLPTRIKLPPRAGAAA